MSGPRASCRLVTAPLVGPRVRVWQWGPRWAQLLAYGAGWCLQCPAHLGFPNLPPSWAGAALAPRTPRMGSALLPLTATPSSLGPNPSSDIPKCFIVYTSVSPSVKWAAQADVSLNKVVNSPKASAEVGTGLVSFVLWMATLPWPDLSGPCHSNQSHGHHRSYPPSPCGQRSY